MAAGSHLEKGNCADLVIAAIIMSHDKVHIYDSLHIYRTDQCPILIIKQIDSRIITSPTRFINAVIMPAARDFGFW